MSQRVETFAVRLAMGLARVLPNAAARWLGRGAGRVAFRAGVRRQVTLDNLRRALPEQEPAQRLRFAVAAYEHLGASVMELLAMPRLRAAELRDRVDVIGMTHAQAALAAGSGAIIASGHYGNWEIGLAGCAAHGLPLTLVVQPLRNPAIDALLERVRRSAGVEVLSRGMGLRRVQSALAANRFVCFMCDQDARRRGVFVPLFGVPASTPKGAAQLAVRLRVPLLPAFARRTGDGRHRVEFFPPIAVPELESEEETVRALLAEFNARLESAVRQDPSQYWWAHRRWKTRPPDPPTRQLESSPHPVAQP